MRQLVGTYDDKFAQVKAHIEQLNSENRNTKQELTGQVHDKEQRFLDAKQEIESLRQERQSLNEKLREEQWKRDQEGKALERQVRKLKDDAERVGMERVQEADRLREDMADRLRDQVEAQKKELQRQD